MLRSVFSAIESSLHAVLALQQKEKALRLKGHLCRFVDVIGALRPPGTPAAGAAARFGHKSCLWYDLHSFVRLVSLITEMGPRPPTN